MTVTTSYPGVYIQELPSLVHSIQPAPTSIAVFVGYTHPYATPPANYKTAIQLFSFADYQANFGGLFYSPWLPDYVGQAVFQFFQNGGPTCYVVGIKAQTYLTGSAKIAPAEGTEIANATAVIGGITFTALQPVANIPPAAAPAAPAVSAGTSAKGAAATDTSTGTAAKDTAAKDTAADGKSAPAAPTVTGIAPANGVMAGGDTVTVTGTGFTGATSVSFGSVSATNLIVLSDTQLAVTSPPPAASPAASATSVADVTVTTPAGTSATSAADQFTYADVVGIPMQVQISNYQQSGTNPATADIVIIYGTTVETYRKVTLASLQSTADVQGGGSALPSVSPALQNSALVTVALATDAALPTTPVLATLSYGDSLPLAGWTLIDPTDFAAVFEDNASLDKVPIFNLLATPGVSDNSVTSEAVAYCERKRAFYIMDTPSPDTTNWGPDSNVDWDVDDVVTNISNGNLSLSSNFPVSTNAALYYPWLSTTDPVTGAASFAPPSGFVAGMYGQEDNNRGVWKSPAGIETTLLGTTGVHPKGVMTDPQQGILNQNALDCIRQFPGIGTVIFGARTTAGADANTAQQQWKYIAVRRTALFIEQSLYANLTWAVFEGNSTPLWKALTQEVTAFMLSLFRQGAFAGDTPSQAFVVQCDSTTTTAQDISNGIVNILVGFAPLVPAEFVVVQIAQLAGQAQS
jgi:phage tail sheath protein FI